MHAILSHPVSDRWLPMLVLGALVLLPLAARAEPAQRALTFTRTSESTEAIAAVLGRLRARDEATLREPLLAMQRAERALVATENPVSAQQLSRWAGIFVTRLRDIPIPDGTRERLERLVSLYEHETTNSPRLQGRHDSEMLLGAITPAPGPTR